MDKRLKKIAIVTLTILNTKSWKNLLVSEVKSKSRVKLFDNIIKNKKDLIKNINTYFDYNLTLNKKNIEDSNSKDMIFEILMQRFDLLQENRKAIISIFKSFKHKPLDLLFLLPQLIDSIVLILGFAKVSSKGIIGSINVKGIFIIYVSTFFVWLEDDNSNLEKTMTSLDNYLNQAGKILKYIR